MGDMWGWRRMDCGRQAAALDTPCSPRLLESAQLPPAPRVLTVPLVSAEILNTRKLAPALTHEAGVWPSRRRRCRAVAGAAGGAGQRKVELWEGVHRPKLIGGGGASVPAGRSPPRCRRPGWESTCGSPEGASRSRSRNAATVAVEVSVSATGNVSHHHQLVSVKISMHGRALSGGVEREHCIAARS